MGDSQCNGLRILSGGHVRYDTNADHLLESEEIAQIPPDEQTLDVFTNASRFMWQDAGDVACNFMQLDFMTQLSFTRHSRYEQTSYFMNVLLRSNSAEALMFHNFMNDTSELEVSMDFFARIRSFQLNGWDSEEFLLDAIIEDPPLILAFGERHSLIHEDGPTTAELFADRILPLLKNDYGYNDIVLEFIPWDVPSSEMEYFMEHGIIDEEHTPLIKIFLSWLGGKSAMDCLYILNRCRELGINVHGGSPSINELIFENRLTLADSIRRNAELQLDGLAGLGKKVIFYGGMVHVYINGYDDLSFGLVLAQKYSYVEIDVIGPRVMDGTFRDYLYYLLEKESDVNMPNDDSLLSVMIDTGVYVMIYPSELYTSVPISPIQNLIIR